MVPFARWAFRRTAGSSAAGGHSPVRRAPPVPGAWLVRGASLDCRALPRHAVSPVHRASVPQASPVPRASPGPQASPTGGRSPSRRVSQAGGAELPDGAELSDGVEQDRDGVRVFLCSHSGFRSSVPGFSCHADGFRDAPGLAVHMAPPRRPHGDSLSTQGFCRAMRTWAGWFRCVRSRPCFTSSRMVPLRRKGSASRAVHIALNHNDFDYITATEWTQCHVRVILIRPFNTFRYSLSSICFPSTLTIKSNP